MGWGGVGFGVEAGFGVGAAGAGDRFDEGAPWAGAWFDEGAPWAGRFVCERAAGAGVLWGDDADDIEVSVWRRDPWDEVFFDCSASDGRDFFGVRAPVDCDFFDNLSSDSTVPGTAFFSFFFAGPCAAPA